MSLKAASPKPQKLWPWKRLPNDKTPIGVVAPCYGASRVVYGLQTRDYAHYEIPRLPIHRLFDRHEFLKNTPIVAPSRAKLFHTWNMIPAFGDFIISYELEIPRYLGSKNEALVKFGLSKLASERCKNILALSEFSKRSAERIFERHGFERLKSKLSIFRGGLTDPLSEKLFEINGSHAPHDTKPFKAIIIGTQLFRKGGMFAIEAFEILRKQGLNVELTIVGQFEASCYVFRNNIPSSDAWGARAQSHPWVNFLPPMPFSKIYGLLRSHDICLYTSLDESLGWLPIESAIAGCPIVVTGIAALPEFVEHRNSGWIIKLPLADNERWIGLQVPDPARREALEEARSCIIRGIIEAINSVYSDRPTLQKWGQNGRNKLLPLYDKAMASQKLNDIYCNALG